MVITTLTQLVTFCNGFNRRYFAFDTETDGLDWHTLIPQGISLYDGKNAAYIQLQPDFLNKILELFLQADTIIGHNLVYDFKVLMKLFGRESVNHILCHVKLIDTQQAIYVIDPEQPRGLKDSVMRYFGQKRLKWEQAQRYGCLSKEFAEYARQDAIDTWNLWPVVKEILEQCQQTQIFRIECAFIPVQVEMETTGILINQELLKEQESQLEIMKCGLERQMCESLGLDIYLQGELFGNGSLLMPLNFVSPKAVANYIHDRMGIELYIKGKTSWSVGKKTINQLLNKHPFFKLFQKYQAVRKLLTTYIRPYWKLLSSDGKIYPSFRHVRSGRCTSYSPNLQNQAKLNVLVPEINIRKLFTASKGNKFLKCDYDSQEIRLLAHITGDTEMINALLKKQDIHLATADRVFGLNIPYDALCKTSKDYLAYKKQFGLQRDKAKTVNFGIAYGKTPEGFAEDWNVPIEEARKVVSTFFRLYPNIRKSIQRCKEFQKLNKYTVTWCGRRRYYTTFTPKDLRSGFNHLIQGTGADMIKKAAGELWRYLQTLATIPRIVLIVHDEIIIENAIESIEQIVEPVRNYMQNTLQLAVPLVADPKVVLTYGD